MPIKFEVPDEKRNIVEFFRSAKLRGTSSLILYFAGKEQCLPNHHFGPAVRAQYLLHFIIQGKGRFSVNNTTYTLSRNQVFLIKPNETTYYIADKDDPWEYVWIAFDGQDAQTILQNCGLLGNKPFIDYIPCADLMRCLDTIIEKLKDQSGNDYELLGNLFLIFGYLTRSQVKMLPHSENTYLMAAINFIQNNYHYNINVQNIADYIGINRSYLYRIFMQELSISPKEFLFCYRIHVAAELLSNTDMTVSAIATGSGFNDISAFCQHFRKRTGFTPNQYRKIDGEKQLTWKYVRKS